MTENIPRWISKRALLLLHDESLAEHGGASGIRDDSLLESALARPENLAAYSEPDLPALAAAYAYGVAKNHPFIDGNKRAAFLAAGLFLALNGHDLVASQTEAITMVLALAASEITEDAFAAWIRAHAVARSSAR
jgi:death on curing protein